jgi:hypothetical protein
MSMNSANTSEAAVSVARDSADDVQVRQIVVYLDGERKAELMFGDSIAFSVSPGKHKLRVDNTWNSREIEIEPEPGQTLRFRTKSSAGQFSRFLLVAFGAGPIYVSLEEIAAEKK